MVRKKPEEKGSSTREFDHFASNYRHILDQSVRISGEGSEYFADYKARYVAELIGKEFDSKILDFGCGVGLLAVHLRKYLPSTTLHGYDVSPASIEVIKGKLNGLFTSDFAQLHHDYDIILLSNVMHHIAPGNRWETISELKGRLSPRGRLVIFEHNPANLLTRRIVDRCPFDREAVLLPVREAQRYLENAELRMVRRDYIVFFPRFLAWLRPLEPLLAWCPAGAQYAIVGEKA